MYQAGSQSLVAMNDSESGFWLLLIWHWAVASDWTTMTLLHSSPINFVPKPDVPQSWGFPYTNIDLSRQLTTLRQCFPEKNGTIPWGGPLSAALAAWCVVEARCDVNHWRYTGPHSTRGASSANNDPVEETSWSKTRWIHRQGDDQQKCNINMIYICYTEMAIQ